MWILTSKKTGKIYYLLPEKSKHTVGRTNTDLILKDDTSISRSHACLYPSNDHVKVIDIGSKYGTFCNENIENQISITKNTQIEIKNGERIKFGIMDNEWTLSKLNICTLISTINNEQRIELQKNLDLLGGRITETWLDSCTHLTMSEITVTLKALKALVENIPIVSIDYWKAYYKNLHNGGIPPKPEKYLPKLGETFLNKEIISFGLNDKRKTIFQGKIFLFMDKKLFDKYSSIIESAGGQCMNLNQKIQKSFLIKKNVIVIQHISSSQSQSSQTINMIEEYIKTNGRRLIPDFEIGLSIIHCNTEKYCNPAYNITFGLLPNSSGNTQSVNILAEQTPLTKDISTEGIENTISVEIPESVVYSLSRNIASNSTESENSKKVEVDIEPIVEIPVPREFNDGNFSSPQDMNSNCKNTKRKRSTLEDDSNRITKKPNCVEKSPIDNLKKTTNNSQSTSKFIDKNTIRKLKELNKQKESASSSESSSLQQQQPQQQQQPNPRKRGKIAVIDDDDDDDDDNGNDLFNFGGTSSKRLKQSSKSHSDDSDDEDDSSANKSKNNHSVPSTSSNANKETRRPQGFLPVKRDNEDKSSSNNNISKSVYINPEGWLLKSMSKMKIKAIKKEKNEQDKDEEDWINSMKGAFEICVKPMKLVSRSFQNNVSSVVNDSQNDSSNKTMNSSKKNFKAFVKKCNYKPQKEVAPTVSFQVMCDLNA